MYHLKTSIPSYRQVFASTLTKPDSSSSNNVKSHFVYHVEVAFLGEYGKSLDQFDERPNRGAKFYRIEKRYSAFLALHNELRRRYRLHCDFPPKKLRNTTPKVLETRRLASELPKISVERVGSSSVDTINEIVDFGSIQQNHRPIFGFTREPFLAETTQGSNTGLPDIITQAT